MKALPITVEDEQLARAKCQEKRLDPPRGEGVLNGYSN